jgi:hypothetical protein
MNSIEIASIKETKPIKNFLHQFWKENHVLSKNEQLLYFQHKNNEQLNFVINKSSIDEITSLLGFIPTHHFDKNLFNQADYWLAIWKVVDQIASPGEGFFLLKYLEKQFQPNSIGAIGINLNVKKIYDALGYTTGILNHYYIANNYSKISHIARNLTVNSANKEPNHKKSDLVKITHSEFAEININYTANPLKSSEYIKNRYLNHPSYNYHIAGIVTDSNIVGIFIYRIIEINNSSCLRIVDLQGDYLNIFNLSEPISKLLNNSKAEYIDFLNFGLPIQLVESWGFNLKSNDTIIPEYFDPFVQSNIDIYFAFKAKNPNYLIFKGDSDQDRPNS